jgi:transcriptional regulator with XRE-family HTH domain
MTLETIANRIKKALEIRNMRQADLASITGIGKSSISTYISGAYEPKQRNIYKISKALNVDEAWLMGYDVPMERKDKIVFGDELENILNELSAEFVISPQTLKSIFLGTDFSMIVPKDKLALSKDNLRIAFQNYFDLLKPNKDNLKTKSLSSAECQLLKNYRLLNKDGKLVAQDSIETLTYVPKYKKCDNCEELEKA